jgi:glycolate oxidase FAD binding subunit
MVDHQPADLTVTVEGGAPAEALAAQLAEADQGWPQADLRPGSTVGGVLAAAASGVDRLRFGPVRDSLLEVVVATGDGRLVKAGGRTVKGVTGYDIPRLMVGSLGTLGVIVQVTLKLWPRPVGSAWFAAEGPLTDRLGAAERVLRDLHRPAAVLLGDRDLRLHLVGPPDDVAAPDGFSPATGPAPGPRGTGLVEVGVPGPCLPGLARTLEGLGHPFRALMGVGICLVGVETAGDVAAVRAAAAGLGGHAWVVDAPEELRVDPWGPAPPGLDVMRRLKDAWDPAGVLNRGLMAGGI